MNYKDNERLTTYLLALSVLQQAVKDKDMVSFTIARMVLGTILQSEKILP